MPVKRQFTIQISLDQVLFSQGIDVQIAREKRPRLIALCEKALALGLPLLQPAAVYEQIQVKNLIHDRLCFEKGGYLQGALIRDQLSHAEQLIVVVCTVGDPIVQLSNTTFQSDPALSLALDGLASAAVEVLANDLCQQFNRMAQENGDKASRPLNPGMRGWPVEEGQPQIFSLLDASTIGVHLDASCLMKPTKSLSFVVGIGQSMETSGETCDLCVIQGSCRYKPVDPAVLAYNHPS